MTPANLELAESLKRWAERIQRMDVPVTLCLIVAPDLGIKIENMSTDRPSAEALFQYLIMRMKESGQTNDFAVSTSYGR